MGPEQFVLKQDWVSSHIGMYRAVIGTETVGSLQVAYLNIHDRWRGTWFWDALFRRAPVLAYKAGDHLPVVLDTSSAEGSWEGKENDMRYALLARVVYSVDPVMVVGATESRYEVFGQAHALRGLGYRTFYGDDEVLLEGAKEATTVHLPVRDAYRASKEPNPPSSRILISIKSELLACVES